MFEFHATLPLGCDPLNISHNYTQLCECLDNQPIKIPARSSGSDNVTGRY